MLSNILPFVCSPDGTLFLSLQGRSKSLTSIDALNPLRAMDIDVDSRSETDVSGGGGHGHHGHGGYHGDRLMVPMRCGSAGGSPSHQMPAGFQRRRKLSTAGKVIHAQRTFHRVNQH
jgi:hypothetical protein